MCTHKRPHTHPPHPLCVCVLLGVPSACDCVHTRLKSGLKNGKADVCIIIVCLMSVDEKKLRRCAARGGRTGGCGAGGADRAAARAAVGA